MNVVWTYGTFLRLMKAIIFCLVVPVAIAFLVGTSTSGQEIPEGFERIPSTLTKGKLLENRALNFSIEAPIDTWIWLKPQNEPSSGFYNFMSYDRATKARYAITVYDVLKQDSLTDVELQKILKEMIAFRESKGWKLLNKTTSPSNQILNKSYRFSLQFLPPLATKIYWTGYIFVAGRSYIFQYFSQDPIEAESFQKFVSSFRLLEPSPTSRASSSPNDIAESAGYMIGAYGLPLALVVWIIWRISRGKPKQPTPQSTGSIQFTYYEPQGKIESRSFLNNVIIFGSLNDCDFVSSGLAPPHFRVYMSAQGYYAQELEAGIKINEQTGSGFVHNNDSLQAGSLSFRVNTFSILNHKAQRIRVFSSKKNEP